MVAGQQHQLLRARGTAAAQRDATAQAAARREFGLGLLHAPDAARPVLLSQLGLRAARAATVGAPRILLWLPRGDRVLEGRLGQVVLLELEDQLGVHEGDPLVCGALDLGLPLVLAPVEGARDLLLPLAFLAGAGHRLRLAGLDPGPLLFELPHSWRRGRGLDRLSRRRPSRAQPLLAGAVERLFRHDDVAIIALRGGARIHRGRVTSVQRSG